jgi:carbamoyltransferase
MSDKITLGISRVHNSSVALFKGEDLIFHIENERLSNIKYDTFPFQAIALVKDYVDHIDTLVVAGVSKLVPAESFNQLDLYSSAVLHLGKSFYDHGFETYDVWNQHHKLHASCAFYNSGFETALCVIKDGMGSEVLLEDERFTQGTYGRENGTAFVASYPNKFEIIDRHIVVNFDLLEEPYYINDTTYLSRTVSEGLAFQKTASAFGFHELDAGKIMGMSSFGKSTNRPIYKNGLINSNFFKFKDNKLTEGFLDLPIDDTFSSRANFACELQSQIQQHVIEHILDLLKKSGEKNLCLSGGFFLNCVANYELLKRLPKDVNVYVEPISSDAGTSIGAAKLIINQNKKSADDKQQHIYLGPKYDYSIKDVEEVCKDNALTSASVKDVAELLANKKIIAIYQGSSESGPRALGNRSILYDPRDPNGKDLVNKVKNREWFRPFAGTVLQEHANDWFNLQGLDESSFMMYAVDVHEDKRDDIPAVVHVDGTCRVQTLTENQNKNFYNLINAFYQITEVPILFNTSFNLAGDCIVETLKDAVDTLNKSDIDFLYLPEFDLLVS